MATEESAERVYLLDDRRILSRRRNVGIAVLSSIAFLCQVVAFFTPGWRVIQANSMQIWDGLWYYCHGGINNLQCSTSDVTAYDAWKIGAFVFEILATLFSIMLLFPLAGRVCRNLPNTQLYCVIVIAGAAACFSITGLCVYGVRQGDGEITGTLAYAFGLAVAGAVFDVLVLLVGIFTYCGMEGNFVNPRTEYTRL